MKPIDLRSLMRNQRRRSAGMAAMFAALSVGVAACATAPVSMSTANDSGARSEMSRARSDASAKSVAPPAESPTPSAPPVSSTSAAPGATGPALRSRSVPVDTRLRPKGTQVSIAGSGDILIHDSLAGQADAAASGDKVDFAPMLAGARSRIAAADFAICHLETPFSDPVVRTEFPRLYVRPELARGVAATGFDQCDTASNWTLDKGSEGIKRTLDALDAAGVGHAGSARSADEAATPRITTVNGVGVAHIAYSWDFNGQRPSTDRQWEANLIDPNVVIADAKRARSAGARIVVASLHMGDPDSHVVSEYQRSVAERVTKSGQIDLVIGHNSHQVQPVEMINGVWVVFGHGNLISGQFDDWHRNREGIISQFDFAERMDGRFGVTRAQAFPILNTSGPHTIHDLVAAWPKQDPPQRWVEAYDRTRQTVLANGAANHGFVVPDHR